MGNFSVLRSCALFLSLSLCLSPSLSLASSSLGDDTVDGPVAAGHSTCKKQFYEELVFSWITAHPATRAVVYANAWFFFDLLVRGRGREREREKGKNLTRSFTYANVHCR